MAYFPDSPKTNLADVLAAPSSKLIQGSVTTWSARIATSLKFKLRYDGLTALLAIPLLAPIASSTDILPVAGDINNQLPLLIQAKLALDEGQFPIRVAPVELNGWRFPEFQYYGQLPHTIGALLYKYLTPTNSYL